MEYSRNRQHRRPREDRRPRQDGRPRQDRRPTEDRRAREERQARERQAREEREINRLMRYIKNKWDGYRSFNIKVNDKNISHIFKSRERGRPQNDYFLDVVPQDNYSDTKQVDNFNENRHNHIHIFRDRGNGKLTWQLTCRKPFIPYDDYGSGHDESRTRGLFDNITNIDSKLNEWKYLLKSCIKSWFNVDGFSRTRDKKN